ncbi:MAG: hypothetical protein QM723_10095 [Myxococcaceae bacterium]
MLTLCIAAFLAAPPEKAAERLHVDWTAPTGCPSREELESSLEADVPKNHTFDASVRIEEPDAEGRPWRAIVQTTADGTPHSRTVEGADCKSVSSAAVLVVTLAATSVANDDAQASGKASSSPKPPLDSAPALEQSGTEAPRPSDPFRFHLRLQPMLGGNVGLFPLPGFSWGLAAAFMTGHLRAQLAVATWSTPRSRPIRGVQAGLTSVTLRGSWLFNPTQSIQLGPSVAIDMGSLSATGTGITAPMEASSFWGAALAGVGTSFSFGDTISAWVTVEAGINLVRPSYVISTSDGDLTVGRIGWPVGRVTLGLEFDLGFH